MKKNAVLMAIVVVAIVFALMFVAVPSPVVAQSVSLDITKIEKTDKGFVVKGTVTSSELNPEGQIVEYDDMTIVADIKEGPGSKYQKLPESFYIRDPAGAETPYTPGSGPGGTMTKEEYEGVDIISLTVTSFRLRGSPVWRTYGGIGEWRKNAPSEVTKQFEGTIPLKYAGKTLRIRASLRHEWGGPYAAWNARSFHHDIGYEGQLTAAAGPTPTPTPTPTPRDTACKDFGVDPKDFDLAYDKGMLEKEFMDFLKDYGSKHKLDSASDKYAGWDPIHFTKLAGFMFSTKIQDMKGSKFITGKEDELGTRINERYKKEGRPLNPTEIFGESLKINGNCVYDALLTCHNYFKLRTYDLRSAIGIFNTQKEKVDKAEADLKKGSYDAKEKARRENVLKQMKWNLEIARKAKENAETPFKISKELRKTDNTGAWYHLFGTLTTGYAERENTWKWFGSSVYTRIEVWGEHRVYKGLIKWRKIDKIEYCWDVWGGYLGGEIYGLLKANQDKVKKKIKENPKPWDVSKWKEPGYIKDAYTGQKIYE